jgi:hypothetical protein
MNAVFHHFRSIGVQAPRSEIERGYWKTELGLSKCVPRHRIEDESKIARPAFGLAVRSDKRDEVVKSCEFERHEQ